MSLKCGNRVEINRSISKKLLENCLIDLKNGNILVFDEKPSLIEDEINIKISAIGFIRNKKKFLKLTNTQRREFISKATQKNLMNQECNIVIKGNEYIDSLTKAS